MEPNERERPVGGGDPRESDGLDRLLDSVRAPLAVIHPCTQLLQRRIRRCRSTDDLLLSRLAVIERAAKSIDVRLRRFENDHRQ